MCVLDNVNGVYIYDAFSHSSGKKVKLLASRTKNLR